ncbi:MAG: HAD-IC family P-type ATPase [Syntrophobacteraceae bacterium]
MIRVVHKLKGRARFAVDGLRGSKALARNLECELLRSSCVTCVTASFVTGRVLVLFSPSEPADTITLLIEKTCKAFPENLENEPSCAVGAPPSSPLRFRPGYAGNDGLSRKRTWSDPVHGYTGEAWHTMEIDALVRRFGTSLPAGLTHTAVLDHQARFGSNGLPGTETRSFQEILNGQIASLPMALSVIAAGISAMTLGLVQGLVVLGVAVANVAVGSLTESRAEQELQNVRRAVDLRARVLREGRIEEISFEDVVVGDVLSLQSGSRIPADARVVRAKSLALDEASLTGESMPVYKTSSLLAREDVPITERANMVYRGTLVVEGTGRAVVVAIGSGTVLGRLQRFLGEVFPPEALMVRDLRAMAQTILVVAAVGCGLLAVMSLLRGRGLITAIGQSLALFAESMPTGLSTLAITAFALGHRDLRENRVLVRRLRALGNLASIQVVCFDKTGTLTHNRMKAKELRAGGRRIRLGRNGAFTEEGEPLALSGPDVSWLIKLSVLCNEAHEAEQDEHRSLEGSGTEKSLVELAERAGVELSALRGQHPLLEVTHRSEAHPFMVTVHRWGEGGLLRAVKGSPPDVLERCSHYVRDGEALVLGDEERDAIEIENLKMAGAGLRVLGMAYRMEPERDASTGRQKFSFPPSGGQGGVQPAAEQGLYGGHDTPLAPLKGGIDWATGPGIVPRCTSDTDGVAGGFVWVGLVGLEDPLRPEAKPLIDALHGAGIRTIVITGDQSFTAQHIGKELRLSGDAPLRVLDSSDLGRLDDAGMRTIATQAHVFARLNPTQKLQVVQAYQSAGLSVAMVGDGVNDVLALKVADVGFAMGKEAAPLARASADLVLEGDDLQTVMTAIATGRGFYRNMRRSTRFLLTATHLDLLTGLLERGVGIGNGPGLTQGLWTNLMCLSLALDSSGSCAIDERPVSHDERLLEPHEMEAAFVDAALLMTGAGVAGAYGALAYGPGPEAGRLFMRGASINQLLHGVRCRECDAEPATERARNLFFELTLMGAVGGHLLGALLPGIGKPIGTAVSSLLNALALGAGGLLTLSMLRDQSPSLPPVESRGDEPPVLP